MPTLLAAADLLEEATTVVIAGDPGHPRAQALAAAALAAADPAVVVLRAPSPNSLPTDHPAFCKSPGSEGAAAYVCRRNVCGMPMADGKALAGSIVGARIVSEPSVDVPVACVVDRAPQRMSSLIGDIYLILAPTVVLRGGGNGVAC